MSLPAIDRMITKLESEPMQRARPSLFSLLISAGVAILGLATLTAGGADSAGDIKYAPDRKVDILHVALDVTPDFAKRTVSGEALLTFKPIAKPLDELRLDAVNLTVSSVSGTTPLAAYRSTDQELVITFASPIPPGKESRIRIRYSAQPAQGLYFRSPSNGYPAEETQVWSQGESTESRHWFPCYDFPNEKFTTEVTCRVPAGMSVLSNGRQVAAPKDPVTGLFAVHWLQDKPHANYLITLVAGYFTRLEDTHRDLPLRFYTPSSDAAEAALTFATTKPALEFFEREIGVPFPWAQYGQVVVRDFHWGGMENTTLTTLTDRTLHRAETETIQSSEELVAHELAHQWFGDYVTCKDWSDVWLNEGFATYYANLYLGHRHGRDQFLYSLYGDAQDVLGKSGEPARPIHYRRYGTPFEQFDYRAYPKGCWVLHMLRSELGEDLFRRCIKAYLDRHPYGTVMTGDLSRVIEELSGQSWDRFFDQWIYHSLQPDLDITSDWNEKTKLAKVRIRQTQTVNDGVMLFQFPLTFRFKSPAGTVDHRVQIREKEEEFYVPLPRAPEIVRIDPEFTVLAKINFKPPISMLSAQLGDASDMIGRLLAAEQMADRKDSATVEKLASVLNSDPFYGVRIKASESLRKIHSDEALDALTRSLKQPDARVRDAVVAEIARFFHPRALAALRRCLETERNPAILATAIKGLAPYHDASTHEILLGFLASSSYRNHLANAAIAAMRVRDDPAFLAPLREALEKREASFTSHGFGEALDALAFLARNERPRDAVREFLAGYLNHNREAIQLAAIRALGSLEDPKSIALLQTFASAAKETPQQTAAGKALAALRAVNKPADNLKDLRQEVLDIKQENQRLSKEVEEMKKKLEASPAGKPDLPLKP